MTASTAFDHETNPKLRSLAGFLAIHRPAKVVCVDEDGDETTVAIASKKKGRFAVAAAAVLDLRAARISLLDEHGATLATRPMVAESSPTAAAPASPPASGDVTLARTLAKQFARVAIQAGDSATQRQHELVGQVVATAQTALKETLASARSQREEFEGMRRELAQMRDQQARPSASLQSMFVEHMPLLVGAATLYKQWRASQDSPATKAASSAASTTNGAPKTDAVSALDKVAEVVGSVAKIVEAGQQAGVIPKSGELEDIRQTVRNDIDDDENEPTN